MKLGVWLAFLDSGNGNPSRKEGKTIDLYCYIKVLKVKPVYQKMTLSPNLGVLEINTLWHFRLLLLIQMFIKVTSSPRLSRIGMPSPILWSHLLKMQRIVLLSSLLRSLLRWELGTNSLITSPGEWLSFRRFTSKLSWSWSLLIFLETKNADMFKFLFYTKDHVKTHDAHKRTEDFFIVNKGPFWLLIIQT